MGTAIAFAQAAALVDPAAPQPAVRVGDLALRWGKNPRAETWLRRAIGLARRARDWESYTTAYVDLGHLYAQNGGADKARRYYVQAMRAARRHGLLRIRGAALHGLARLNMASSNFEEAKRCVSGAVRAYGRGHPAVPELMVDMADLLVLTGSYERAVHLLQKLLVGMVVRPRRERTLALLARAAAGAATAGGPNAERMTEIYRAAWSDAWMLITGPAAIGDSDPVLLELARAAAMLNDSPRLEQTVRLDRDRAPLRKAATDERISGALKELAQSAVSQDPRQRWARLVARRRRTGRRLNLE
jgi:tetratricopeptide (TPR) repeat protein